MDNILGIAILLSVMLYMFLQHNQTAKEIKQAILYKSTVKGTKGTGI